MDLGVKSGNSILNLIRASNGIHRAKTVLSSVVIGYLLFQPVGLGCPRLSKI